MTDLTTIYDQLKILSLESNVPISELVRDLSYQSNDIPAQQTDLSYAAMLTDAIGLITQTQSLDVFFDNLFGYFSDLVDFDIGLVLIIQEGLATVQYCRCDFDDLTMVGKAINVSPISLSVEQKSYYSILDVHDSERLYPLLPDYEIYSTLVLSIVSDNEIIGYFMLCRFQAYDFDEAIASALFPFVNLASGAIQNQKLLTTVSQSADELATLYHATSVLFRADNLTDFALQITEVVVRTFDYADCGLMVVDTVSGEIERVSRAGSAMASSSHRLLIDGDGLVPKAIREQRLIYEPDVRQASDYVIGDERSLSELVVPLKGTQGILGVLDFQSPQINAFNERDQRLMVAFAERVAPILENVRLYDELRQYAIELESHVADRTLELQQTKEQLETIIRSSPDAIVLLDKHGVVKQANLAWLSMVGLSAPEVVEQPLVNLLSPVDREQLIFKIQQTLQDELENDMFAIIYNRSYNRQIEVEISIAPILEGRETGIVCNIRDMTQHRETERLLREALEKSNELSDLKTKFVTMASHEFRTPLTTILSSSDLVKKYFDRLSPASIVSHLQKIIREVNYLNQLIEDILLIGREAQEGFIVSYASHDLIALIRQHVEKVKSIDNHQHPIQVKISERCRDVITDANLITHIIDNLLSNACKYSQPGQPVLLEITAVQSLRITVRDKGIGIPESDFDKLFEIFHRGSNVGNVRGTGIGLAIVHESVQALGGEIHVRSKVNKGTVISIELPLREN